MKTLPTLKETDRVCKEIQPRLTTNLEQQISGYKNAIKGYEKSLVQYQREINKLNGRVNADEEELKKIKETPFTPMEASVARNLLKSLLHKYEFIKFYSGGYDFKVKTKPIVCYYDGQLYFIGSIILTLENRDDCDNGVPYVITFINISESSLYGAIHPHIQNPNYMCWGDGSAQADELIRRRAYIDYLVMFAEFIWKVKQSNHYRPARFGFPRYDEELHKDAVVDEADRRKFNKKQKVTEREKGEQK